MIPDNLNPAQRDAVLTTEGPLLVLAGAGSGKTRVITQRIAHILRKGTPAERVVALTFTNKAAAEMAERVSHVLAEGGDKHLSQGLVVSTFHSFGLQVLGRERASLGGAFTIFDQGDQVALVKELLASQRGTKNFDASAVIARISNAKNAFISPEDFVGNPDDEYDEVTKLIYPKYQSKLRSFLAYDFDDLVVEVARLIRDRPDMRARYRGRFRYLLVDEYQDTNGAQLELLRLLAEEHRNLCVVGDDDQSIYAWRGADVRNILDFEEHFPGAKIILLEQNYRSQPAVLAVANAVISKRSDAKHRKVLFSDKPLGEKPMVAVAQDPDVEATWVVKQIRQLVYGDKVAPKDIAILYRSNSQGKLFEEGLRAEQIKYRVVGGQTFFERKEVKDVLAYLKVAMNKQDELSLRRIVNYPPRGIGETTLERISMHALARGWTLYEALERIEDIDGVSNAARDGASALCGVFDFLRQAILVEGRPASFVGIELCDRIDLRTELMTSSGSQAVASRRWANVDGLLQTLRRREDKLATKGKDETARDFGNFLHALTLNFGDAEEDTSGALTLSTLHGSKGLEFDHVFLVGCEEGFMPHSRTTTEKSTDMPLPEGIDGIEEERRLFYVGVTRAKKKLIMTRCKHRAMRGKAAPRTLSRFLLDVPEALIDEMTIKDTPSPVVNFLDGADALLATLLGGSS